MGWFEWWKRSDRRDPRITAWQQRWEAAVQQGGGGAASLRAELDALGLPEEEIEIEREMADALASLSELDDHVSAGGLPIVETGHRVVGTDLCHFSAPASMPDDPAQPSGRLLLTSTRAIFAGGPGATTAPWHGITEVLQAGRDVVLVRPDRDRLYRFRCNSYADALCGAYVARRLAVRRPQGR